MDVDEKAWLVLQNGKTFEGRRVGARCDVTAEICFTTGMTGYLETLTDPSYHGQIVVQTFPLIGNCGVIPADFESRRPSLSAYVARELCDEPSNFRSRGRLAAWLEKNRIAGLTGLDTRRLTREIRESGTMNATILGEPPSDIEDFTRRLAARNLSSSVFSVTCKNPFLVNPDGGRRVVLWDFGFKGGLARELAVRDCKVLVVPAGTRADEILAHRPDGVLLSNGPGDPASYTGLVENVGAVARSGLPLFGVCLGHQLLALARGARTVKLKYGHRGNNQPVRETATGRLFTTSQNHGYAVDAATLPKGAVNSWVNLNDGTCEGVDYADINAFSVQFHPEGSAGPRDTAFLFERFLRAVGEVRRRADR